MRLRIAELSYLAAVCLLAGCATPALRQDDATAKSAPPADTIILYQTPAQVGAHYREIAVLLPGRDYAQDGDREQMRKRAAALGANAIILDSSEETPSVRPVTEYVFSGPQRHVERVVAIIVADAGVTADSHP